MEQHSYEDTAHKIPTDWEGVTAVIPNVGGWLEIELQPQQIDHIWKCIEQKKEIHNKTLVGHIHNSYRLEDIDNIFWKNTLSPLCDKYGDTYDNLGRHIPVEGKHPYYLNNWWVNYQKQHEFNPLHNHSGVYSFVIWLKIPTDSKVQNDLHIGQNRNGNVVSDFEFAFTDLLGKLQGYVYKMDKGREGTMLFFPSSLKHAVNPFFECDEDRISVSGNIFLDTKTDFYETPPILGSISHREPELEEYRTTDLNRVVDFNGEQQLQFKREIHGKVPSGRDISQCITYAHEVEIKGREPKEVTPIISSFQPQMKYSSKGFNHTDEMQINYQDFRKYFSPDENRRGKTVLGGGKEEVPKHHEFVLDEWEYPFWARDNKGMLEWIDKQPPFEFTPQACKAHMTGWDAHVRCPEVEKLWNWMRLVLFPENYNSAVNGLYPVNAEIWGVRYDKGTKIDWHNHRTSTRSFAYYIKCPEGSPPLMFKDNSAVIEPAEGKLILFDGRMSHKVPESPIDGRYALSGNLFFE